MGEQNILTGKEKQILCRYRQAGTSVRNKDLIKYAAENFGKKISDSACSRMLSRVDLWLNLQEGQENRQRMRGPKHPVFEAILEQWLLEEEERSTKPVPGPKLVARAKELATELHIEDFKCSAGWLNNFKRRHSLLKATAGRSDSRADAELLASLKDQIEESHREAGSSKKQKLDDSLAVPEAGPSKTFQGLLQDEEPLPGQIVVTEDDNDMLISQREAVDSAKILLAYFSERPSLGYEHQKAMRKIAAAIMRHKQ